MNESSPTSVSDGVAKNAAILELIMEQNMARSLEAWFRLAAVTSFVLLTGISIGVFFLLRELLGTLGIPGFSSLGVFVAGVFLPFLLFRYARDCHFVSQALTKIISALYILAENRDHLEPKIYMELGLAIVRELPLEETLSKFRQHRATHQQTQETR